MPRQTVTVSGLDAVLADLAGLPARVEGAAQNVIERYTDLMTRAAKGFAPVDEGDLRENVRAELERLAGHVVSDLPYSETVEGGRRDMPNYPAQPYMAPAFDLYLAPFVRDLAVAVGRAADGAPA